MNDYITDTMAAYGCGLGDTREIADIVDRFTEIEWDTLDAMHNFGAHTTLTPYGSKTRAGLISRYSDDDLLCFAAYVNAYRNVIGQYPQGVTA